MKSRYSILFVVLSLWIFFSPLVSALRVIDAIFILSVLLAIVYSAVISIKRNRAGSIALLVLGIPFLILGLLNAFYPIFIIQLLFFAFAVVFFVSRIYLIVLDVKSAHRVELDTVFGAICIYLLIGFTWTWLYRLALLFNPGAFNQPMNFLTVLYYSFITLTAVGDGSFRPIGSYARSLTILEAVTGVLYIAIIIALIVGVYATQRTGNQDGS